MNDVILLDFDGTITSKDTIKILLSELLLLRPWCIFGASWFLLKMVWSNDNAIRQMHKNNAVGHLIAGLSISDMSRVWSQFRKKVRALYRPSMVRKISEATENGTSVLIVTASPSFAISHCVSDLPVTVIGTEFQKQDSVFCGELSGRNCFGIEKVKRIEVWEQSKALDWSISEAWSDNFSDYPMLKMAKQRYWIGGEKLRRIVHDRDPSGNFVLEAD